MDQIEGTTDKAMAYAAILLADNATGVGVADDVIILGIIATVGTIAAQKSAELKSVTYTKTHKTLMRSDDPSKPLVYSGRTHGFGQADKLVRLRDARHNKPDYDIAKTDRWSMGTIGYCAIRGREQQLIDYHGGAINDGGTSGNLIRGVSRYNPMRYNYHQLSNYYFGPKAPY